MSAAGTDSGAKIITAFCDGWMMHRPRPQWAMFDPQSSLCKGQFPEFLEMVGIGSTVTAGEAHWQNGLAEALIGSAKRTMRRIRNEHPDAVPESVAALAAHANNHHNKQMGFAPIQWAYGVDPDAWQDPMDPLHVNRDQLFGPHTFVQLQGMRDRAGEIFLEERARTQMTRLLNSSSKPMNKYEVGDHVYVWRSATLKARKRDEKYNPEPRFIGPGRVVLLEPAVNSDRRSAVIWVLMGTTLYRCAPEQLRLATQSEVITEVMRGGRNISTPKTELLKRLQTYVDVTKENAPTPGTWSSSRKVDSSMDTSDEFEWQEELQRGQKRRHDDNSDSENDDKGEQRRRTDVADLKRQWNQLISINNNRRREGLPPIMTLPESQSSRREDEEGMVVIPIHETAETVETQSFDVDQKVFLAHALEQLEPQVRNDVIAQVEQQCKYIEENERLKQQIQQELHFETQLLECMVNECIKGQDARSAWFVEFDIDNVEAFCANNVLYVKKVLESKGMEVRYDQLSEEHKQLFDEAKAREVSEVIESVALRKIKDELEQRDANAHPERHLPMRWVLTWKPVYPAEPPKGSGPHVVSKEGDRKAKARVVIIGFRHPDLIAKHHVTGRPILQTSSPTISRLGRHTLLQAVAFDKHVLESADAKSAFLQADNQEENRRLWTKAVPEISTALGVSDGQLLRIVGAIYGLTNAPRIFWKDVASKLEAIGAIQNPIDRCVWIFKNPEGKVCGRVGAQVDDFLIAGNMNDRHWLLIREQLKTMYRWSPWQKGDFTFSGCRIIQTMTYSIHVNQEEFCNGLSPVVIENEKSRSVGDPLSSTEVSQTRALLMKAQWRALQTAPQFCARINLASSSVASPTLATLQEANNIIKDMRKTGKEDIVFHAFNYFRKSNDQLDFHDVVFLHWGDAGHKNRPGNHSTGGLISGMSTPEILQGYETPVSLLDWKSWKLRRVEWFRSTRNL